MLVEKSTVKKLLIKGVPNLDPVTVYVENFELGRGKITIECFGDAWAMFWNAMGRQTLEEFFMTCDVHYLAGKLSGEKEREVTYDFDAMEDKARKAILKQRREYELSKDEARDMWTDLGLVRYDESLHHVQFSSRLMHDILGADWYLDIPYGKNHHYEYLCRIINVVKEAFKEEKTGTIWEKLDA